MPKPKKEIRQEVKRAVLALAEPQRAAESQSVCAMLKSLIEKRQPRCVALFSPLRDEVDITPLMTQLKPLAFA